MSFAKKNPSSFELSDSCLYDSTSFTDFHLCESLLLTYYSLTGDKIAVIHNKSSSEEIEEDQTKTMLLYLQIPVAIAVFGLLFFAYKCFQKRNLSTGGNVFYEEEMKLNKHEML